MVGGSAIHVQAAPWTVFVEQDRSFLGEFLCTGSILDARHILTAAHCVFDDRGDRATPAELTVKAGISNFSAPLRSDAEQERSVSALRVHPGYRWTPFAAPDDVAVLTLAQPLQLGGAAVQALVLPPAKAPFPSGVPVGIGGFGRDDPTTGSSGPLSWMTATVAPQGTCPSFRNGTLPDNAILLCASAVNAAVCSGDSGSALVKLRGRPTLLGVTDGGIAGCPAGSDGLFTYVGAPEILRFLKGDLHPPRSPREPPGQPVGLSWQSPLVVGATLRCSAGGWSHEGRVIYTFTDGSLLQRGSRTTFVVPQRDVYNPISCEVAVTNAGGTTLDDSRTSPVVAEPPSPSLRTSGAAAAAPGRRVSLRLTLRSPAGLWGPVHLCALPAARVGRRVCASGHREDGKPALARFTLNFRIAADAPRGTTLVRVEAVAGLSRATATVPLTVS